jgi:glycosyltransferase involved in cell wall biosynthesis
LRDIGVDQVSVALNNSNFDVFIKELNPKVVMFDRFMMEEQFGWRVAEQCPQALRVLDTEDLHCLRKSRQDAFKKGYKFDNTYLFNDVAKREIASIYRCDLSLIISEAEIEILKNQFKVDESLLLYLPFMLDFISDERIKALPRFYDREHFITIGNFLHAPNYNAILYLKETIWPLIRAQLPNVELHVYGAYASQKVTQLNNKKQGFLIKGFADDVNEVMQQAKICLAPIRFGAGLKGKLVDAMQNGTACITTTIGAEGMFGSLEPSGFIEDDSQAFVDKAIQVYKNKALWAVKQQNGFTIVNQRFNKLRHQEKLLNAVAEVSKQLINRRQNNFIGQMLQHQTMHSTKYMSKWIEEKNKTKN